MKQVLELREGTDCFGTSELDGYRYHLMRTYGPDGAREVLVRRRPGVSMPGQYMAYEDATLAAAPEDVQLWARLMWA